MSGPPSPTSKIQHRLKFLTFKTCPLNCIGRSWNSSTERHKRDNFTREPLCLQQSILLRGPSLTSFSRRQDTYGSYVTLMPVESIEMSTSSFSVKTSIFLFCFFWYGTYWKAGTLTHALTECLHKREKRSTSRHGAGASYQTIHPGISARAIAFGRSWPFAAFCYRPRLPVRHWGRDMAAPKPYETNSTPTHSSGPPLSILRTKNSIA